MSGSATMTRFRFQLLGIVFLLVCALFVALSVGFYHKSFTTVVPVRLATDHVGNQLRQGSDVKIRGVVVGEVRSIETKGDGAELSLAMRPDKVNRIPQNVSARLLPKTLFGGRYVALQVPEKRATKHLSAGDVIGQDRSSAAIEVEKVLNDLMPLLQTLEPQKVATTLSAISQAVEGRGKQLGDTAVQFDRYLREINPSLPDLKADMRGLAAVADVYDKAAPGLLEALSDLTTTTRTVSDKQQDLSALFSTLTTTSVDLRNFLEVNQNNLIRLTSTARPTLEVLAKYAPEYPCVLGQIANQIPKGNLTMGEGQALPHVGRLTIEVTQSRGKYLPGVDDPQYVDKRGPRCYEAATPDNLFPQYPPDGPIQDGSTKPPAKSQNWGYEPLTRGGPFQPPVSGASTVPQSASVPSADVPILANSPEEQRLIAALTAPSLGVMPSEVPAWSGLLLGPLYRGSEVTLR